MNLPRQPRKRPAKLPDDFFQQLSAETLQVSNALGRCLPTLPLILPSMQELAQSDAKRRRKRLQAVYDRLHAVLNELGRDGEVTTRHDSVMHLMAALAELDGGTYDPHIMDKL
jgi:hypothetical protein